MIFQTPRLSFHRPEETHREFYIRLFTDPEIMRFVGGPITADQASSLLDKHLARWATGQPGGGVVIARDSGALVAVAGIGESNFTSGGALEIGCMIDTAHQRKGYANELCAAFIEYGFSIGATRIIATPNPENRTSIRILEKFGFRFVAEAIGNVDHHPGLDRQLIYELCP